MLSDITWTADPAIFTIGSKEIRWYSLMFIIGFGIGYKIVERMWRRESINPKWIDPLLYYTLIGTVVDIVFFTIRATICRILSRS